MYQAPVPSPYPITHYHPPMTHQQQSNSGHPTPRFKTQQTGRLTSNQHQPPYAEYQERIQLNNRKQYEHSVISSNQNSAKYTQKTECKDQQMNCNTESDSNASQTRLKGNELNKQTRRAGQSHNPSNTAVNKPHPGNLNSEHENQNNDMRPKRFLENGRASEKRTGKGDHYRNIEYTECNDQPALFKRIPETM